MPKKNKSGRVKLIANPLAGDTKEAMESVNQVVGYLQGHGLKVDVALTKPKEEATPVAKRASKKTYQAIIAMGGDGTIEAIMRGMVGSKTPLGIIAQGTANNVAKSLGIPSDLKEACDLIASGKTRIIDIGQVRTKKVKKFYFFEMVAIGLAATIYPYSAKLADGKLSKLKDTVNTFLSHETKPTVYLTLNGESKVEVQTMMVVVSNTPIFGVNFNVAPQAALDDHLLDVSVYPDFSKAELIRYYAAIMNEGYSGDKKAQHYQARKVKVKTSPKLDIMADGIALGKGTARIKVVKNALRVIAPEGGGDIEMKAKEQAQASGSREVLSSEGGSAKEQAESVVTIGEVPAQPEG